MAAGERRGGSDCRLTFALRRSPLVLLLALLLPGRPALGNEGAAAGSCQCVRYHEEPPVVKLFPHRLVRWERCGDLIRFVFPRNKACGLDGVPWVLRLIALHGEKQGQEAARVSSNKGSCQPSPTSAALLQPLSSVWSTLEVPRETPPSQQLPALTTTMAALVLESVRSVVLARNGAVAEVSPTRFAQEESVPGWHYQTIGLSALGIVLLVAAGLLCWWRPPRRHRQAALFSEQQVSILERVRAPAAAASGREGCRRKPCVTDSGMSCL